MSFIIKILALGVVLASAGASLYIEERPLEQEHHRNRPLSLLPESLKQEVQAYTPESPYADTSSHTLSSDIIDAVKTNSGLTLTSSRKAFMQLSDVPDTLSSYKNVLYSKTSDDHIVELSLNPGLQTFVETVVKNVRATHVGAVVMDPESGKILAMAERSHDLKNALTHAGYPAASLFKIVTSAAALELSDLTPDSDIRFRGGTYTLNRINFKSNPLRDNRTLSFESALAKSCNPVFSRIALGYLNDTILEHYVRRFHFNKKLPFDVNTGKSKAEIPGEEYELGRTAAGFGNVTLSPIQAASFIAAIANKGLMPAPYFIQRIFAHDGSLLHQHKPALLDRSIQPETANLLKDMMEETVISGTSKSAFTRRKQPIMKNLRVSGKTGTLTGKNPRGLTRWFVGLAPVESPSLVVSLVVVNPRTRSSGPSYLAQKIFSFADSARLIKRD